MDPKTKRDLAIGREHYQAGDYGEAEAPLKRVRTTHDGFADVHNMLGVIAYQRGDANESATCFERALELNPRYNEAALNYSVALNELGRYEEARKVYEGFTHGTHAQPADASELDDFVRGKIANLHASVADAYHSVGLASHAISELRRALKLCPDFADLRAKLGVALRDAGDAEGALKELTQVRESRPNYVEGRVQLGLTHWMAGDRESARGEWQKALLLDESNRAIKAYLSMAEKR